MIISADLYCGAGGASAGLRAACLRLGLDYQLTAINHWDVAIATHSANFPGQKHLCTDMEKVKAKEAVPDGYLDFLIAAPSCVHFSPARGGTPVDDQQRSGAWEVIHWCRDLNVRNVLVENVPAFQTWGPLRQKKCKLTGEPLFDKVTNKPLMEPDPARKGIYFRQWIRMLRDMDYRVEYRILNAAHFGDATTRRRLFIQARKGRPVTWPKPTHHAPKELHAFPKSLPWIPAREIIDWSLPSQSIYGRKKPLAKNTLKRIFAGLRKFCGRLFSEVVAGSEVDGFCHPFLVVFRNNCDAQSLNEPLPAICTSTGHFGIATPIITPYLAKFYGGHDAASLDDPLGAITANYEHYGLCQPFLVTPYGPQGAQGERSIDSPLPTILSDNHTGVCQPFLVRYNGGERSQSINNPLTTVDTSNRFGLCQPYIINYNGNGDAHDLDAPLDTITTRDRFALVSPELRGMIDDSQIVGYLDIHFRMLQPHELAAAHSFPTDYEFTGGREDRVKQVGNSWPCNLATALCEEILR